MKLEYRVLWFEDDPESVESFVEALSNRVEAEGFEFVVEFGICSADAMDAQVDALRRYNPYDLIVFDYDLGEGVKGEVLAGKLRSKIWTEIVYYSGNRTFKELIDGMAENHVEGVFCAVRQNLEERIWSIIESQMMRICDLNNMRGIVLDAMSVIDYSIRKYFSDLYKKAEAGRKSIVLGKLKRKFKDRVKEVSAFQEELSVESVPNKVFDHRVVDFQVVRHRLAHKHECFQDSSILKTLQDLRNKLAHQPSKFNKATNVIELVDQLTNESESFDYARFKEIRSQLLDIRKKLRGLGVEGV